MSEVLERPATKQAPVLVEARMGLAEYRQQCWVVDAEEGVTVEQILSPGYWAYTAFKFQMYDRIEVRQETGDWILELIVLKSGNNWANVLLAAKHDLVGAAIEAPAAAIKHQVVFKGPHKKHCVIRLSDSALIQDGFSTKVEADAWLINHERVTL